MRDHFAQTRGNPLAGLERSGYSRVAGRSGAWGRWRSRTGPIWWRCCWSQAERRGDKPFLWEKRDGEYRAQSWREVVDDVSALAAALRAGGLKAGDRVLLLGPNAPKWAIADFAIMAAGGVTVPVYTTNTAANHAHILSDSGAEVAIVANAALAKPFFEAARKSKHLRASSPWSRSAASTPGRSRSTMGRGPCRRPRGRAGDRGFRARDRPTALACIIYTSGTGGNPKGVMLSHRAVLTNCVGAIDILKELHLVDDVFLSFLPLSHAYEHTAGLMFPVSIGAEIYFAERADTLMTNMAEARPTIMTAVPRLYEIVRDRMLKGMRPKGGLKARLFWSAVELGRKRYEAPGTLSFIEQLVDRLVERLVRDKVRARFGGRLKALVSGGAPLDYELGALLHRARPEALAGLRPDRGRAGHQLQSLHPRQAPHRRPAAEARRGQDRRRWRDPRARADADGWLLGSAQAHRRDGS